MTVYVTFELPYRKFIRFWIQVSENGVYKERISNIEVTYSYNQHENLLDSVTASITDYNEDEEEEED